ncbi:MAG: hypothetical protein HOW73_17290 [Polyangiaceae bacterium]|nr:hypothetical protein [Polyangiaceae bacterium]
MSTIVLANATTRSDDTSAEFRLFQGNNQIARIGVHPGAKAGVPTTASYTARATTSMGDFTLTSNTLTFSDNSTNLLAQVVTENGYYDFQLTQMSGTQPSTILCENTWREPVQFTLAQPGTPVQIVTVVDEHNNTPISTAQQWQCYAIVNGITTGTVSTTNPNATFTVVADNNDLGFMIVVS